MRSTNQQLKSWKESTCESFVESYTHQRSSSYLNALLTDWRIPQVKQPPPNPNPNQNQIKYLLLLYPTRNTIQPILCPPLLPYSLFSFMIPGPWFIPGYIWLDWFHRRHFFTNFFPQFLGHKNVQEIPGILGRAISGKFFFSLWCMF